MERARIEKISKALADATRLKIFEAISAKEMVCGELVALRGCHSRNRLPHLKILADAGLIECRAKGNSFTTARFLRPSRSIREPWRTWQPEKSPEHAARIQSPSSVPDSATPTPNSTWLDALLVRN